jgi:cytochrome c-type biogenesis protein CcmH
MAAVALAGLVSMAAAANDPRERLADPREEARARALFEQIRCLVCQNETIDDSEADLAGDLRRIVRAQVHAGASDDQVKAFLVARYGEFVLMQPRFSVANLVLWILPFGVAGAGFALWIYRRRATPESPPLSAEEEAKLASLESGHGE